MNIPIGIEGQIQNSELPAHRVLVQADSEYTGGFFVYEWWDGASGPNHNAAFDSWVEDKTALIGFFVQSGWEVDWQFSPDLDTDALRRSN